MAQRRPPPKYLDRGLKQYIYKQARKNLWRVAAFYELSDLIQDGFLAYAICRERYGYKVENQKHFMSLCQRVFSNHITDLANARTKAPKETPISQFARKNPATSDADLLEMVGGSECGDAEMIATLKSASEEIRTLMRGITEEPTAPKVITAGLRLTTNEKLNALLGTCGHDFEGQLRSLLGLDPGQPKYTTGFTYGGDLEECKRAPRVYAAPEPKKYGKRKVYQTERYAFRFTMVST